MKHRPDKFMRDIIREIPGPPRQEELECGHIVTRPKANAKRRRCLECAGEHYDAIRRQFRDRHIPETFSQRFTRLTARATGWVAAWRRRAAV